MYLFLKAISFSYLISPLLLLIFENYLYVMLNLQLGFDFLRHQFKAKTRHGVHSPFAYRLIDEVIYDFHAKTSYRDIEKLRSELLLDERCINITDLGVGSQVNSNKQKKVSTLTRNALKPARLAQLIYRLAADLKPGIIIELGTCLGITTAYLAKAAPNAWVLSIEGCPETATIALQNLKKLEINNAELLVGDFDEILPKIIKDIPVLDFVFIDGNHRKEATLNYFKWCLSKIGENSLLIFDDIYWSQGMKEAWEEIKAHPEVSVTIDLFYIGLVFFKKGRVKEDFKIRF